MNPAPNDMIRGQPRTDWNIRMTGSSSPAVRAAGAGVFIDLRRASHASVPRARNQRENGFTLAQCCGCGCWGSWRSSSTGAAVDLPASRRARALLGWLALDRRMHPRSGLAARFWPDVLDESARTSLRSALSALAQVAWAGQRAIPDRRPRRRGSRRQNPTCGPTSPSLSGCVEQDRLEEAFELCRGELLAGLDDDWVYERRDEHRDRVADVLARLAARAEGERDLQAAIDYTRRQVALDHARGGASAGSDAAAGRRG